MSVRVAVMEIYFRFHRQVKIFQCFSVGLFNQSKRKKIKTFLKILTFVSPKNRRITFKADRKVFIMYFVLL